MERFGSVFSFSRRASILDVGGTAEIWALLRLPEAARVVLLNMPRAGARRAASSGDPGAASFEYVHGDGCRLPFADRAFDIVFSNSVIEHVGGPAAQAQFAGEVARAGRGYWVQTPNRHFPIETHLLTPLVHLLPRNWRAFIVRRFTVWQWIHRPAADERHFYIEHFVSDIRLLTAEDMRRLFPDAVIIRERFLMFTKSLIAYRAPE
jgi:SAM-dependent methyltransferase